MTYTQVLAWDNLLLAWRKAARHKRGKSVVAGFEQQSDSQSWLMAERVAPASTSTVEAIGRRYLVPQALRRAIRRYTIHRPAS